MLIASYWFKSDTSDKLYETLVYDDNKVTCNCPGWTRRVKDGVRSCKHIRLVLVDADFAQRKAAKFKVWSNKIVEVKPVMMLLPLAKEKETPAPAPVAEGRAFSFDD